MFADAEESDRLAAAVVAAYLDGRDEDLAPLIADGLERDGEGLMLALCRRVAILSLRNP